MKLLFIYIFIIISIFNMDAQYIAKYSVDPIKERIAHIEKIMKSNLIDSIGNDSMLSLLTQFKNYSDCLYYSMLWNLSYTETDKEKRILMLRKAATYPYYLIRDYDLQQNAIKIYETSIWELIRAYHGDAEGLLSIPINIGYQQFFYPTLKYKVEAAGGVWDRGPVSRNSTIYINQAKIE